MSVPLKFLTAQSLAVVAATVLSLCANAFAGAAVESGSRWNSRTIRYAICDCSKGDPKPLCTSVQCVKNPSAVATGIAQWNQTAGSAIKLVPRDPADKANPYLLYVSQRSETTKAQEWCYTEAGYSGANGPHQIVIGDDCTNKKGAGLFASVMHETGHAVGLYHEQQRIDRDTYLDVVFPGNTTNLAIVQSGRICPSDQQEKCQFLSAIFTREYFYGQDLGDYDFKSIMHYRPRGDVNHCTIDEDKPYDASCMQLTDAGSARAHQQGMQTDQIGTEKGLSELDVQSLNQLYQGIGF